MAIKVKRVYDQADATDGFRVLVDRLWPRGLSKSDAKIDLWLKGVAPSNELRKWYQHDPGKWIEFKGRYFLELASNEDDVKQLMGYARSGDVCFLYSSAEPNYNNAVALRDYINSLLS